MQYFEYNWEEGNYHCCTMGVGNDNDDYVEEQDYDKVRSSGIQELDAASAELSFSTE